MSQTEYVEKIRSIATPRKLGRSERQEVIAEEGPHRGTRAGEHVVHWDGRQDAVVEPQPIKIPMAQEE